METNTQYRYLPHSDRHLIEMSSVWVPHVKSEKKLYEIFNAIEKDEEKDLFLRVGIFYKYLVVEGAYQFPEKILNKGMSYIDDTYKYIAIFSLIETLETPDNYVKFYQWLQRDKDLAFPVGKKPKMILDQKYQEYKEQYGSIKAAVRFFERLDDSDKSKIKEKFKIINKNNNKGTSLKQLAQTLYDIRSKFVHETKPVLGFGPHTTVGRHDKRVLVNKLTMKDLRSFFERGFLKRFGWNADTPQQKNSP